MFRSCFRLFCMVVGHRRSRSRAYLDPDGRRRSYCRRCATPMRKDAVRGWLED
jgi:hypothetical protein